jgi:hypothetical protein
MELGLLLVRFESFFDVDGVYEWKTSMQVSSHMISSWWSVQKEGFV